MSEAHHYEVIVGNIGTVYSGPSFNDAKHGYSVYRHQSYMDGYRCSGESVTLMKDGEPHWEAKQPRKKGKR